MKRGMILLLIYFLASTVSASPVDVAREYAIAGEIEKAYAVLEDYFYEATDEHNQMRAISCMVEITVRAPEQKNAMKYFIERAVSLYPNVDGDNKAMLGFHIAKRYCLLGDYKKSQSFLSKSIPEVADSKWKWHMLYQVGYNYYLQGKYKEAATEFQELRELEQEKWADMSVLDMQQLATHFQLKEWPKVIKLGLDAIDRNLSDSRMLMVLDWVSESYYQVGDFVSAMYMYEEYIKLHKKKYPQAEGLVKDKRKYILDRYKTLRSEWQASQDEFVGDGSLLDLGFAESKDEIATDIASEQNHPGDQAKAITETKPQSSGESVDKDEEPAGLQTYWYLFTVALLIVALTITLIIKGKALTNAKQGKIK